MCSSVEGESKTVRKRRSLFILYIIIILIVTACGKKDAEDAKRLAEIEEKITVLFNEEQTDLAKKYKSRTIR